jgi:sugar lactone lactonase YvrE
LVWVDCDNDALHSLVGEVHESRVVLTDGPLTAVCNRDDGGLVLLAARRILALDEVTGELASVAEIPDVPTGVRFNDAKPAPDGRLWAGTVCPGVVAGGAWWTYRPDEGLVRRYDGITHANGIGWNQAGSLMYLVDSGARTLSRAMMNPVSGLAADPEIVRHFGSECGIPDGLAMDDEDHLWLAMWGGRAVLRIDPLGRIVGRLPMLERNVTSCAFIGKHLDTLAVTTAADEVNPSAPGGTVHLFRVGARGRPVSPCSWLRHSMGEMK